MPVMRFLTAGAVLFAALAPAVAQDCVMSDGSTVPLAEVVETLNEIITIPENIAEYQKMMATYPGGDEIEDARTKRTTLLDSYKPRKGYPVGQDLEPGDLTDFIDVPARFCGLEYETGDTMGTGASIDMKPGQNCTTERMEAYAQSLIVPVLLPVLLGILYIILMPIWYVLRCCHCCGGRKASIGRCKGLCCNNYDEKPSYVAGRKFCDSINFCKFLTFICFLLCAVAAVIGLAGNNMVDTGLRGTMDVTIYELRTLLQVCGLPGGGRYVLLPPHMSAALLLLTAHFWRTCAQDGNTILSQMNWIAADMGALGATDMVAEITGDQTCQLADLDKTVRDGEADISDTQDLVLDIRMLAVMVIFLVPLLFSFVFFITNLLQCCWCLTCLGALLILVPGLLSFISAGVHLSIALVTSDLCLEMDLHLHYYMDNATRCVSQLTRSLTLVSAARLLASPCLGEEGEQEKSAPCCLLNDGCVLLLWLSACVPACLRAWLQPRTRELGLLATGCIIRLRCRR